MLLYFKDENDLRALRIAMGYYFHNEIVDNPNKLPPRALMGLASRFIRIIEQLDKEIDYYEPSYEHRDSKGTD